jgi:hypothetical protein
MSRQLSHCPKCGKLISRVSMSGGSVIDQGLQVPDPDDFAIVIHPCRCVCSKRDASFPAFLSCWKKAYEISESKIADFPVAAKPIAAPVAPFTRLVPRTT